MGEKEEALELETRRKIFAYVSKYPGSHMRKIKRELDLAMGEIEYHLNYLEEHGLFASQMSGNKKRYYVANEVQYPDRKILGILRQKMPRKIILLVMKNEIISFGDILKELDISKSTLSFHLKKLIKSSILEVRRKGRQKFYSVKDQKRVVQILITYKSSFVDEAVERFIDTWGELKP